MSEKRFIVCFVLCSVLFLVLACCTMTTLPCCLALPCLALSPLLLLLLLLCSHSRSHASGGGCLFVPPPYEPTEHFFLRAFEKTNKKKKKQSSLLFCFVLRPSSSHLISSFLSFPTFLSFVSFNLGSISVSVSCLRH